MKKQMKAWAIINPKGMLKEWDEVGSGLRIVISKKEADKYLNENSREKSKVVPCIIICSLPISKT